MRSITAVLHTRNDAVRLGRCLETLYPCDEILVIDHDSTDATVHVAREYGARTVLKTVQLKAEAEAGSTLQRPELISTGWIFCIDPRESLTEALAASLFGWKLDGVTGAPEQAAGVFLRQENADGWIENPVAQTRLVPAAWKRWNGRFPLNELSHFTLEGRLLRFEFP